LNIKKAAKFSVGPIGDGLIGLVTLPMVTWFFSVEDIGRLTMLHLVVSFSLLLFSLGLDQAYVREFHEVIDKPSLLITVLLPGVAVLSLVLLTLMLTPLSMSNLLFGLESKLITILLILAIFLAFLSRYLGLVLRMQERGIAFSMSQVLPKIFFIIILGIFVIFLFSPTFTNLILATVFSQAIVFVIFVWNTRIEWIAALNARIDKEKLIYMMRYSFPFIGGGLAFWGLIAMDKIFLRAMSSLEELGVYSVAVKFAGAALIFQSIFSTIWAPTIYKWVAEGVEDARIKNVIDYTALVVLVLWSLAGMFSWVITYILPPKYEQVHNIMLAAMAYPLLYTLSEATGVGIGIKRKTVYSMLAAVGALIVNILGNYLLIPKFGAAGAAISSAIAFMVFFIARTEASSKLWKSFDRVSLYSLILSGLLISIMANMGGMFLSFGAIMWFLLLAFSLFVYRKNCRGVYEFFHEQMRDNYK
jgi:O-antigen/teichoic acid export membrane protein